MWKFLHQNKMGDSLHSSRRSDGLGIGPKHHRAFFPHFFCFQAPSDALSRPSHEAANRLLGCTSLSCFSPNERKFRDWFRAQEVVPRGRKVLQNWKTQTANWKIMSSTFWLFLTPSPTHRNLKLMCNIKFTQPPLICHLFHVPPSDNDIP